MKQEYKCSICKGYWGDTTLRRKGKYKGKRVCDTCNQEVQK